MNFSAAGLFLSSVVAQSPILSGLHNVTLGSSKFLRTFSSIVQDCPHFLVSHSIFAKMLSPSILYSSNSIYKDTIYRNGLLFCSDIRSIIVTYCAFFDITTNISPIVAEFSESTFSSNITIAFCIFSDCTSSSKSSGGGLSIHNCNCSISSICGRNCHAPYYSFFIIFGYMPSIIYINGTSITECVPVENCGTIGFFNIHKGGMKDMNFSNAKYFRIAGEALSVECTYEPCPMKFISFRSTYFTCHLCFSTDLPTSNLSTLSFINSTSPVSFSMLMRIFSDGGSISEIYDFYNSAKAIVYIRYCANSENLSVVHYYTDKAFVNIINATFSDMRIFSSAILDSDYGFVQCSSFSLPTESKTVVRLQFNIIAVTITVGVIAFVCIFFLIWLCVIRINNLRKISELTKIIDLDDSLAGLQSPYQ